MTAPQDPDQRNKALTNAALKFAAFFVLVIAVFYAAQYAAYNFMSVISG
jgi:hypothetical protein